MAFGLLRATELLIISQVTGGGLQKLPDQESTSPVNENFPSPLVALGSLIDFNLSVNRRQVGLILVSTEKPEGDKSVGGTESTCPPINVLACIPEGCSMSIWKFNSLKNATNRVFRMTKRGIDDMRQLDHMTRVAQVTWLDWQKLSSQTTGSAPDKVTAPTIPSAVSSLGWRDLLHYTWENGGGGLGAAGSAGEQVESCKQENKVQDQEGEKNNFKMDLTKPAHSTGGQTSGLLHKTQ